MLGTFIIVLGYHKAMFNRQTEAVLSLTAFSIFADKRVISEEISKFMSLSKVLRTTDISDIEITEPKLLHWFEMNRANLQDKMTLGPAGLKRWINMVIDDLSEFKQKSLILDWITQIAKADGEHHISEKALFVLLEDRLLEKA